MPMWKPIVRCVANSVQHRVWTLVLELLSGKEYVWCFYMVFVCMQVYRMCMSRGTGGQAFLCPEGTKFNQRTLVCDHAAKVKCHQASSFFHRNLVIHEASLKASGGGRDNKVSGENNRNLQPKKQEIVKAKGPQIQQVWSLIRFKLQAPLWLAWKVKWA